MKENNQQMHNIVGRQIMIKIIADLIQAGDDENEILDKLNGMRMPFKVDETFRVTIKSYFKSPLENAIIDQNYYVATILVATVIEHSINEFYVMLFKSKFDFSNTKIEKILRMDLEDKLTWLFILSTKFTMEDNLIQNIMKIAKKRNSIVHYKPKEIDFELFDDSFIAIITDCLKLIELLESELDEVLYEEIDVLKKAKTIYYKYFSETQFIFTQDDKTNNQ